MNLSASVFESWLRSAVTRLTWRSGLPDRLPKMSILPLPLLCWVRRLERIFTRQTLPKLRGTGGFREQRVSVLHADPVA